VSALYRGLLIALFSVSLFALLVMVPLRACFGLQYLNNRDNSTPAGVQEQLLNAPAIVSWITGILFFCTSVATVVIRLIHPGRVCAGDFLAELEKENDVIRTYYDIEVGFFLFIIMILSIISLALTVLVWVCCCGALCCLACGVSGLYQERTPGNF